MTTGPRQTTYSAGTRHSASGNTSLTPTLAARSSARWRRLVRDVDACVRSAWAMLVPNRSVCVSIVTSARTSSTCVRLRQTLERFEPRLAGADFVGDRAQLPRERGQRDLAAPRLRA